MTTPLFLCTTSTNLYIYKVFCFGIKMQNGIRASTNDTKELGEHRDKRKKKEYIVFEWNSSSSRIEPNKQEDTCMYVRVVQNKIRTIRTYYNKCRSSNACLCDSSTSFATSDHLCNTETLIAFCKQFISNWGRLFFKRVSLSTHEKRTEILYT